MTSGSPRFDRVIWIVLDSVGIGELPDAKDYGDVGRDTLGHIARSRSLQIPNLQRLGISNIAPLESITPPEHPAASYGKGATKSPGKDTTTGHWEMAGVWLDQAFPVYPNGFPKYIISEFERQIGRRTLGNKPASGTEIIKELGLEHVTTGFPIVYTSGDSVFQVAAHEDVIPIAELYRMCEIARKILDGPNRVGRVIARPFAGPPSNFQRTERRHDYAVEPPKPMLLDVLADRAIPMFGVGKIHDIANKHKHFALGMRHLCAQPTGDFVAHARVSVLHVIPARLPRPPKLVQIPGQAPCCAHHDVPGFGSLIHHSNHFPLRDRRIFADAVDVIHLFFPIIAKTRNPCSIVFTYLEPGCRDL